MHLLDRMERRFGRFAIKGLMRYVIAFYIIGYIIYYVQPSLLNYLTLEPFYIFHNLQIWRLVSWVLMPPNNSNIIFVVIMLILYYQLGNTLEQSWGAFRFNVYIFGGVVFSIIGSLILYAIGFFGYHQYWLFGSSFSTFYINMSIFLAFAVAFPDMKVMLYFFIPIKMKWMGLVYAVLMVYEFVTAGSLPGRVSIVASLANFLIYFLATRNLSRFSPHEVKRRNDFKRAVKGSPGRQSSRSKGSTIRRNTRQGSTGSRSVYGSASASAGSTKGASVPFHKCAICGRTELDDPNLTFRYCSKCKGNFEYCQDHLFTHKHIM